MKSGPYEAIPVALVRERSTVQSCPAAPSKPLICDVNGKDRLPCPPLHWHERSPNIPRRLGESWGTSFASRSRVSATNPLAHEEASIR